MSPIQVNKVGTLTGHLDAIYTVIQGSEPQEILSAGGDGKVVRWDLSRPEMGQQIAQLPASIYSLHRFGDLIVAGQNFEGIHLLDPKTGKETGSLKLGAAAIFDIQSHEGKLFIATGDGALTAVDAANLTVIGRQGSSQRNARTIAINPTFGEIAVGYSDNFIRIFDLDTLKLKNEWAAHTNSVFTLRYTPDHQILLSGARDARLKAWKVETGYQMEEEIVAHMYAINNIAFSPDGKHFVTCSLDKSIKLWDAGQRKLLKVVDKARHAGHATSVNKCLWTPYDERVVSVSDDRTISVWKFIF